MPATDKSMRPLPKMHFIFLVSSLLLFLTTVWMFVADYDDEWRRTQREWAGIQADQARSQEDAIATPEYVRKEGELKNKLAEAKTDLEKKEQDVGPLQDELNVLQGEVALQSRRFKFARAEADVARAEYDIDQRDSAPAEKSEQSKKKFDDKTATVARLDRELQSNQAKLEGVKARLAEQTKQRDELKSELDKFTADLNTIVQGRKLNQPEGFAWLKNKLVNTPLLDLNPTYKIDQVWLPDMMIKYGMADVARFDRCVTCHLATNRVEEGNAPSFPAGRYAHPFQTHPNPDLYMTGSSPHPKADFGCTICHDGQGSGTSFHNASHTANDPAQGHEWSDQYGWFHNHFWEYPMQPKRFVESTCLKCHHDVVELKHNPTFGETAPKLVRGFELIERYGCFGCHEIRGFDGMERIGPDMRLEPVTPAQVAKIAADPNQIAGTMRKVGPSLVHLASKVAEGWAQVWVEEPKKFRPTTRMPQFFHLSNQRDPLAERYGPVEVASIVEYLMRRSEKLELLAPADGYKPNAERGKLLFSEKGCLGCHSHADFPKIAADFGPDLSRVSEKIRPGEEGFRWLYTWIRDPMRHHPRTKMPNLFLEPQEDGNDPAADIAAYLLKGGPRKWGQLDLAGSEDSLDELVRLYLVKAMPVLDVDETLRVGRLVRVDVSEENGNTVHKLRPVKAKSVKGDEVELVGAKITRAMKLNYVGRRTITRYGCYGCHDIPGFEDARPIGTALQDWGRKDSSKLAFEHIAEYLRHHGEPDGSSTSERAHKANQQLIGEDVQEREMSAAYFYEQIMSHGRAGFAWQKLRAPRSYDYRKIETKGYDERLRMPMFPFDEQQIEEIATVLLGLVAEPPAEGFVYHPEGPAKSRIEGDKLLRKYNCGGCHVIELPEIRYGVNFDDVFASDLVTGDYAEGRDLMLQLKPPVDGDTGERAVFPGEDGNDVTLPVVRFRGLPTARPSPEDEPEDREYNYRLWETLKIGDKVRWPGSSMTVPELRLVEEKPARGGAFAEWLVEHLMAADPQNIDRARAWQNSPPPLYQEGLKVQTPWLYEFLRNPPRIRYTTVLRMPRFNMSDEEAQKLVNYFAAVDGAAYPYQDVPQRQPEYLAQKQAAHPRYLEDAWALLNVSGQQGLCIKCHAVGGQKYSGDPKKDIQGPDLHHVSERLRPDWLLVWLYKPAWVTPYTSMPAVFPDGQKAFEQYFGGVGKDQTQAVRDVLLNYHRMMEQQAQQAQGSAGAESAPEGN